MAQQRSSTRRTPSAAATPAADPVNSSGDRPVPAIADEFLGWLITSLATRLSRSASNYYTRHWGIGTTEYRLVLALGREGPCTAVRAAGAADIDKGAASRSLQVLQREGMVELVRRGREMQVLLTAEGRRLCTSLQKASTVRDQRLTHGFAADEVNRLCADLRRLIDNLPLMAED